MAIMTLEEYEKLVKSKTAPTKASESKPLMSIDEYNKMFGSQVSQPAKQTFEPAPIKAQTAGESSPAVSYADKAKQEKGWMDTVGAFGQSLMEGIRGGVENMGSAADYGSIAVNQEADLAKRLQGIDITNPQAISDAMKTNYQQTGIESEYAKRIGREIAQRQQAQGQRIADIKQKYEGAPLVDIAVNAGQGVGNMIPAIAIGGVSAPALGTAAFATNVFGSSAGEALNNGATLTQAGQYATASAALETAVESVFGGIPNIGDGILNPETYVKKFTKSAMGRLLANRVADIMGEGVEEAVSEVIQPFLVRAFYDENADDASIWDALYAAGNGALVAAILGIANVPGTVGEYRQNKADIAEENAVKDKATELKMDEKSAKKLTETFGEQTAGAFVQNNIDADFSMENGRYVMHKDGQTVPVTKEMFDYSQRLKAEPFKKTAVQIENNTAGINQVAEENTKPFDVSKLPQAQQGAQPSRMAKYTATLGEGKAKAEYQLNKVRGDTKTTNAQFIEDNLDAGFVQEGNHYFLEKDGRKTSITKAAYDYASYLQEQDEAQNVAQSVPVQEAVQTEIAKDINVPGKDGTDIKENQAVSKKAAERIEKAKSSDQMTPQWLSVENNSQNIEKNIENESSTEYNKNRGIAHPSLKHYADAINNGDVFSVDFIENLPEIAEADKRANFDKSTFELYPVGINPERDTLREEIKDYLLSDKNGAAVFEKGKLKKQNSEGVYTGEVKQERIADIVIGPPAAGKSTVFADKLSNEHSARIIDSDIAKSMLPEFDNGYGASMVQDESAYIVEVLALDEAIERGDNIVLPKVGKSYNSLFEFISVLKDEGYTVNLYYNELPTEKAINRAFARFITTGRYLPIKYLKAVKAVDIENTYKKMKESGLIDYYEWKSNDVRFGDEPTLKESGYGRTAENQKKSGRQNAPVGSDGLYSVPQRENSSPQSNTKSAEIKGASKDVPVSLQKNNGTDMNVDTKAPTEIEKQLVRDIGADAAQQEAIKAEAINRGLGETIELIDSYAKRKGIKVRYYNGQMGQKYPGFREGNTIYLDIRNKNMMLYTAIHETIHTSRGNNGKAFNKLYRQLDALQKNSTKYNALAEIVGEKYAEIGVTDSDKVSEEIVAKLSESIIENPEEFLQKLGEERTFIDAVFDFLKEIKNTIVANFGGNGAEKARVDNALMALEQYLRNEAGVSSSFAKNNGTVTNKNGDVVAVDNNGNTQFNIRTFEDGGREYLERYLAKQSDLAEEDKADILSSIDAIYNMVKEYNTAMSSEYPSFTNWCEAKPVIDDNGNVVMSVIVPNGDYKMNIDVSTVCKKRKALDVVLNKMAESGDLSVYSMSQPDIVKMNQIIKRHGFEVACSMCFVDAKRYRIGNWANSFADMYNSIVETIIPEGSDIVLDQFNYSGAKIKKVKGRKADSVKTTELRWDEVNRMIDDKSVKPIMREMARAIKINPSMRKMLSGGDLISSKGMDNLKMQNPELYKLTNRHMGTAKPKTSHSETPYTNEVLSAKGWTPEKAYAVGGVRIQSFSDYMANMFFDYAQIIADLSAKQLPGHGYTKELDFAKIFGLTGLKINMSAMPKAMDIPANIRAELNSLAEAKRKEHPLYKYYQERAGLDAKGNYLWADESIDVEEAIKLQNTEGYEKNCGIICVGISDAHIRKLMADDNMKMVIPYHKSGINPVVAKMQNIDLYTDYTNEQNTRYAKSGKKLRKNSFQFDFYADLAQTNDPRQTAENYVRDCESRNFLPKFDRFAYKLDADGNRIKGKDGKYVVDENYYKLLIDFRVYDNAGNYAPQGAIKMSYPENLDQLVQDSLKTSEATAAKMDKGIDALLKDIKNEISIKDSDRVNTKPVYSGNYDIKFDTQHSIDIGEEKGTGKYKGKSIKEISEGTISEAQQKRAKAQALLEERQQKTAKLVPEKFAREQAKKAEDGLPESVGAAKANPKNITHMVNEYGEMKPGENPERFISMPVSTDGNDRVGKFARTAAEAGVTSDKMVQAIEKAVARGDFSHEIWRDKTAINDAVAYIEKYGYGATLDEFYKRVDNKGQVTKGDMTKAMTMYAVAVENDDIKTALKLAVKINKAAVNAGQVVQSVRILKKSSPEGRLFFAQKSLEAYQDEVNEKYGSKAPKLVVDDSILQALKDARTEEEIKKATTELHQVIADQLPFSWSNFITSWRYLAMLGNPRTQVRNVISNAVNSVASEYVNWIQAGIEKSTRMSISTTTDKPTQKQIDYAKLDYQIVKEQLSGEGKYKDNSLNSIERMKNPFSFPTFWGKEGDQFVGWRGNVRKYGEPLMKGLTKWNELTNTAMEKGDLIFSEKAYVKAFARYLKANKINPATITGEEVMDARAWATRQALESVFRENNQLANRISRLERNLVNSNNKGGKAGAVLIGGLMPFKSTPLNITKRAFEYTPLGIIKGIADIKTNEKVYMPAAINDIAKGLSGTSLIILGAALAKYGLLKGGLGEDKEDKMAKQMGQQSYSIDTPWFSYTLDWGGAALMPLFVGADIYESNSEDDSWLMNIVNALANAGSPIIETSMMTGMMDAIQSMSYEDVATEKLVAGLSSAMANYLGQFVPTLFGQVARAVDDTSRSSYTDVKGALKPLAKTAQKAQNKIPFLSKTNVPYMDVWGNDEKNFGGNVVGRLAYNMLSPGYVSTKSNDKVEKMLADLYDKTGETSVLPSNYTTYKRMGDETIRFTDKQYEAYTKAYGQTAYGILEDLSGDKDFKSMEDAYKAEVIAKAYKYSTAIASNDVVDKELTARQANQQKAMAKGLSAYEVFGGLIEADGMGSEGNANGTLSKSEVTAYIESRPGLSKTEKAYLFAALGNSNWTNPYI